MWDVSPKESKRKEIQKHRSKAKRPECGVYGVGIELGKEREVVVGVSR